MKKLVVSIVALICCAAAFAAEPPKGWTADIDSALAKAKKEHKHVLVLFTGSDWCGWCKKLKKETLDSGSFKKFAKSKLILVYFDFPRNDPPPAKQMETQKKWAKSAKVGGYPTTVILNGDGKVVTSIVGYRNADAYQKAISAGLK